jgi:hypothetical protein
MILESSINSRCRYDNHSIGHEEVVDTDYAQYIDFLNHDYERYASCLNDPEYLMDHQENIDALKDKFNHMKVKLPFQTNNDVIIYYDSSDEKFHYYTKSSVDYKVLNSICRSYVLEHKCMNLFVDEDELQYIQSLVDNSSQPCEKQDIALGGGGSEDGM